MSTRFLQRFDERLPSLESYKEVQCTLKSLRGAKKVKGVALTLLSSVLWTARGLGALMLWAMIVVFSFVSVSHLLLEGALLGDSLQKTTALEGRIRP